MTFEPADRLLRVDLSTRHAESVPIPSQWLQRYIGGKGLGARYLYEELDADVDPMGPNNVLLFMLGPLSGLLPGETRYAAITKSPLTGGFLDSYAGGEYPTKLAGALGENMGLLVAGVADEPVRIIVENGGARVEPATTWGDDTVETAAAFPDSAVACIGPAGEAGVTYATIASDSGEHHAGRGGAGAVMGAKRVKTVVAKGTAPSGLSELRQKYTDAYRDSHTGQWLQSSGTVETIDFANEVGVLATRGWDDGQFDGADELGIAAIEALATGREYDGESPGGFRVETPDGETVPRGATAMSLGAGLGIEAFDAVAALGETCNRLGLDLISAGNVVAWAINASEAGLLDKEIAFGDPDGARTLLKTIASRETELGDVLADGVDAAAARFGGDNLVPTVKAMELPAYDPRGAAGMALAYATSDRGACHRRARPVEREVFEEWDVEQTARVVVDEQDQRSVLWSLIVDDFVGDVFDDLGVEWLDAVGLITDGGLRTVGERIWTLTRLFNVREGFARKDDELPPALQEPLASGPNQGEAVEPERFEELLDAYYERRNWAADGRPTRAVVDQLGLTEVLDEQTPLSTSTRD